MILDNLYRIISLNHWDLQQPRFVPKNAHYFQKYAGIYQLESNQSMFKKIIEKLKFGYCKTKVASDVNVFTESEKKKSEDAEK